MTMVSNQNIQIISCLTLVLLRCYVGLHEMRSFSIQRKQEVGCCNGFIVFQFCFGRFEQSGGSLSLFAANNLDSDF